MNSRNPDRYWAHPNSLTLYIADGHEVGHVTTVPINCWDDAYYAYVNVNGSLVSAPRFTSMEQAKAYVEATYELQR